jgi:hypothetical protein
VNDDDDVFVDVGDGSDEGFAVVPCQQILFIALVTLHSNVLFAGSEVMSTTATSAFLAAEAP